MKQLFLIVLISHLFSQNDTTLVRDNYNFNLGRYESIKVELNFGLGELKIGSSSSSKTIYGTIEYNPDRIETDVDFSSVSNKAFLSIEGKSKNKFECCENGFDFDDFNFGNKFFNHMDFELAANMITELEMDFGLGEANIDITNISLTKLELDCGLSDVKMSIDLPNKISCKDVSINTGLGDFNGYGLGNLNVQKFKLDIGLGAATIDLRGKFEEDMDISVDVGLGALDLIIPRNVNIMLVVDYSFLSSVDVDGLKVENDNNYISETWDDKRPTITAEISVGIGSVDIEID